jgi:hypothetical protein
MSADYDESLSLLHERWPEFEKLFLSMLRDIGVPNVQVRWEAENRKLWPKFTGPPDEVLKAIRIFTPE